MKAHIGSALIALALLAVPLSADLGGITTTPANLPSAPSEMTVGSDGNLWILTEAGKLAKLAPGGAYTESPLQFGTDQFGFPNAAMLTFGIDGNVWITGFNGHIERVTGGGMVTDFAAAPGVLLPPVSIVGGADGALWFFDRPRPGSVPSIAEKLGRIDIYGQVTTYDLGISGDSLAGLVSGGDGNIWFIDETKNQVVKFSIITKSVAGTFAIPSASNQNGDDQTVLGLDGNIWFTRGTSIDRVKVDGTITEFHVPSGGQANGIAQAGDGNIWFTEYSAGKIGQLVMSSITSGGSATINETGAILANAFKLFVLPPGFTGVSGKTGALDVKPCPVITFIVKKTPPTAGVYVSTTVIESACADISTVLNWSESQFGGLSANPIVQNTGPDVANGVTAIFNLTAPQGVTIDSAKSDDPAVAVSVSGLTVTLTRPSLEIGKSFNAFVFLRGPNGQLFPPAGGTEVAFSQTPDPNPKNNVSSESIDPSVGIHVPLPPDVSDVVITPIIRGK